MRSILKNQNIGIAAIVAGIALTWWGVPSPSHGKIAKCYLSVNGRVVIDGKCEYDFIGNDENFSFDDTKLRTHCVAYDLGNGQCTSASKVITQKGTFGQLQVISKGKGRVFWNEGRALHAQDDIGIVTRNGACWQSKKVKLCAW